MNQLIVNLKQWGLGFSPSHTLASKQGGKRRRLQLLAVEEAASDHDWTAGANGMHSQCRGAAWSTE